jgi:hypothetical protein
MHQYIIKCLFIQTQPTRALIDRGGGYHLGASNLQRTTHPPSHPVFPTCPQLPRLVSNYTILSTNQVLNIPSMNQGIKSPKSREWNLPLDFYQSSIH